MGRYHDDRSEGAGAGVIVTSIGKHMDLNYEHIFNIMNLVWKLLRQHISIPQFAGFAFANLFGMLIVLSAFSFIKTCCLSSLSKTVS